MESGSAPTVPNITAAELFALPAEEFEEANAILRHIKPKYTHKAIKATSLYDLSFEKVEEIKLKCSKKDINKVLEALELVFNCPAKKLLALKCYDFYKLYNWFTQSLNGLIQRENKVFKDEEADGLWKAAEDGRMAKFGSYNTTIQLAEKFGVLPSQIAAMKYIDVFSARLYYKELATINKNYSKLLEQKNKARG